MIMAASLIGLSAFTPSPSIIPPAMALHTLKFNPPNTIPTITTISRAATTTMAADYATAASALFANVRLPASILAGAMIPLGFGFALPTEGAAFTPETRQKLIRLHRVIAVIAYASLLTCIVDSSVAINSLAESSHEPVKSVIELVRNEYELAWIGTNINFLAGVSGVLILVAIRTSLTWEIDEGQVAACVCLAALLTMGSVVDEQVRVGGYAPDFLQLLLRYVQLSATRATSAQSPLLGGSLLLTAASGVAAVRLLMSPLAAAEAAGNQGGDAVRVLTTSQVDVVTGSLGEADAAAAADAVDAAADAGDGGGGDGGDGV